MEYTGEILITQIVWETVQLFFYNPFRKKWVYSIRSDVKYIGLNQRYNRARDYHECDNLIEETIWGSNEQVKWLRTDCRDITDKDTNMQPQLYNVDAVAYESIMLGMFQIHKGPENHLIEPFGLPKITELIPMYSRDGFHFLRPSREAFIKAERLKGNWDRGYVQSVGGVCLIMGDELWFYYSGFSGDEGKADKCWANNGMYANGATGIAKLRRDGFVSLNACNKTGSLVTENVIFSGEYLFVNIDGKIKAEVLDENENVIEPYSFENCIEYEGNSTKQMIVWKDCDNLKSLKGRKVKFRFAVTNGKFYSFWVSADKQGKSGGYMAAGAPYEN